MWRRVIANDRGNIYRVLNLSSMDPVKYDALNALWNICNFRVLEPYKIDSRQLVCSGKETAQIRV